MMTLYNILVKAFEEGKRVEIRKYRCFGNWSAWKVVSDVKTLGKCRISVEGYDEFEEVAYYCPYDFRIVE